MTNHNTEIESSKTYTDNPLRITDTTFRDAHQSLFATRMRTADIEPIAQEMNRVGFYSIEVWGGATFDVCTRFLAEDPWERLRSLKKLIPDTPLMMLLRGQNLVGYRNYPDDVVHTFIKRAAFNGIDIFRVFDALNDERNLITTFTAIKETGKHIQACICYSVTGNGHLEGPIYDLDYFIEKASILEYMGADSLCIKDMAGLLAPYDAYLLIRTLKERLTIPIQLHTHYTSGMAGMTCLKAAEAGVDVIDACLAPFALRTSQPAVEPLVQSLQNTVRDTGLDINHLISLGDYLETIAPKYMDYLEQEKASVIDVKVLQHQIPGGMASNMVSQLREADALEKLDDVLKEVARIREDLGYPPLVTPASQIIGTQAVSNVLFGRYKLISSQIKDYIYGLYGRPPGNIDPKLTKLALKDYERGQKPLKVRPADTIKPELEQAALAINDISSDIDDILIYALYPTTGMRFLRIKHNLDPLPNSMKATTLEQVQQHKELIAKAKAGLLIDKDTMELPSKSANTKTYNVYVGDELFRVEVDPKTGSKVNRLVAPKSPSKRPVLSATPGALPTRSQSPTIPDLKDGQAVVVAPMPGILLRYLVKPGQEVQAGDAVAVLEAMKMENELRSPIVGIVKTITQLPGDQVVKDTVLVIIDAAT